MNDAPPPSLLDWLKAHWVQPPLQRLFRFGLAGLAAVWGLYLWLVAGSGAGFFLVALAIGLAVWGLAVRGPNTWTPVPIAPVERPARPSLEAPPASPAAANPLAWLAPLRLPAALILPILGQIGLSNQPENLTWSLVFYALGLAAFGLVVWREKLWPPPADFAVAEARPLTFRLPWLAAAGLFGGLAFFTATENRFTTLNVAAWLAAVVAWLGATYSFDGIRARLGQAGAGLRSGAAWVRVTWTMLALLGILTVGAYFRLAQIDVIPPEMTSDHAEKLLDVADLVLGHQTKLFFERNTGREPLQFYWTAWIGGLLGTGVSYLSLKIGTALIGLLTLPYVFLLARELEDSTFALLATLLVAVSFWATAISRVGLRFPLYPVFVAPVLYHVFRALQRGTRNDFLLAGLFLGAGLYGYSPIRILPVAVVALVGWALLWPAARGRRLATLANLLLLALTALVVFLPLLRFSVDQPDLFWYRTASRLGDADNAVVGSPLLIFLENNWNALRMFNWQGDQVWVNTLPGRPVLDAFSGALLVLGAGYTLARLILRREWRAGALLWLVPILMLPSTLSLAYPVENPSVVRTGGAIPLIFMLAAYPLWLLVRRVNWNRLGAAGAGAAALTLLVVLGGAFGLNRQMYFEEYPAQYVGNAQNASEIGAVIRSFATTVGSFDTAWVRPYPFWVDTRAAGMYAGQIYKDYAIQLNDLAATTADPRAKLFILNVEDTQNPRPDGEPPTLPELRRLYPDGTASVYYSPRPYRDFVVFFVPAQSQGEINPAQTP